MKRTVALLAASAIAAPLIATVPAAASYGAVQARRASSVTVSPRTVVLHAKASTWVTLRAQIPGLPAGSWVNFHLRGPNADYVGEVLVEDPDGDSVFQAKVKFDRYNSPGNWRAETEAYNYETGVQAPGPSTTFAVRRFTKLSVNAGPEPVRMGKALTVTGYLKAVTAYYDGAGYAKQRINVYFRKKGTAKWVYAGHTTTGKGGKYTKKFKAKYDGYWLPVYPGNTWYASAKSSGDFVDVR